MLDFSYGFKKGLYKVEEGKETQLKKDLDSVKAFVEKCLTACLDSTSNMARTTYTGIDL